MKEEKRVRERIENRCLSFCTRVKDRASSSVRTYILFISSLLFYDVTHIVKKYNEYNACTRTHEKVLAYTSLSLSLSLTRYRIPALGDMDWLIIARSTTRGRKASEHDVEICQSLPAPGTKLKYFAGEKRRKKESIKL
uniref:Uncharacterized protein n=1 Tax=Trichogramma kaykai TaxID=54128 RepID=A0ABD2VY15_9HYME